MNLNQVAKQMVAKGKGILAIDESMGTCQKRFDALSIQCTEPKRREYRHLLVSAPGIEDSISGMILFDETIRQSDDGGKSFVDILNDKGILVGIKVDMGSKPLSLNSGEEATSGLDGLPERLAEYKELGAVFAKWRAVYNISDSTPTRAGIQANAHALARYAAMCQEAGLVPMVEPEVMYTGDHSVERCYEVCSEAINATFNQLKVQGVDLEGVILKTSMVMAGDAHSGADNTEEVADMTVKCFMNHVPASVPGIVFLSGGQSPDQSVANLNMINQKYKNMPWPVSFSYGRGIQADALSTWAGDSANVEAAQKILVERANACGKASLGEI